MGKRAGDAAIDAENGRGPRVRQIAVADDEHPDSGEELRRRRAMFYAG